MYDVPFALTVLVIVIVWLVVACYLHVKNEERKEAARQTVRHTTHSRRK